MSNYYDDMYNQLIYSAMYPQGGTPGSITPEQNRELLRTASNLEDEMLRYQLRGRRERGDNELEGAFAEAYFPGYAHSIWMKERGLTQKGPEWLWEQRKSQSEQNRNKQYNRDWAEKQRGMLGMNTGGPTRYTSRLGLGDDRFGGFRRGR